MGDQKLKLTYFDIQGLGEMVRLAFVLNGIEFEDERLDFEGWSSGRKAQSKFGKLPELTLPDGTVLAESGAILRYVGRMGKGTLYPADDALAAARVDEALGLQSNLTRAWSPVQYLPRAAEKFGFDKDYFESEEGKKRVAATRERFVKEELPQFLDLLSKQIEANGNGFLASKDAPTIADCEAVPMLRQFQRGHLDHVPTSCLDSHPTVTAYIERFLSLPEVAKWYAAQQK